MDIRNTNVVIIMMVYFFLTWWDLHDIKNGIDELKREIHELKVEKEND